MDNLKRIRTTAYIILPTQPTLAEELMRLVEGYESIGKIPTDSWTSAIVAGASQKTVADLSIKNH